MATTIAKPQWAIAEWLNLITPCPGPHGFCRRCRKDAHGHISALWSSNMNFIACEMMTRRKPRFIGLVSLAANLDILVDLNGRIRPNGVLLPRRLRHLLLLLQQSAMLTLHHHRLPTRERHHYRTHGHGSDRDPLVLRDIPRVVPDQVRRRRQGRRPRNPFSSSLLDRHPGKWMRMRG